MAREIPYYANLRTYTTFSIGVGIGYPKDIIKAAVKHSHNAFAITDNMTLAAHIMAITDLEDLKSKGLNTDIGYILGSNIYLAENKRHQDSENRYTRLMLFAKNQAGYSKLSRLIAIGGREEYKYYKARIDMTELLADPSDLVCSTGCLMSIFGKHILEETGEEESIFLRFKESFKEDFYVEIVAQDTSQRWSKELEEFVDDGFNKQLKVNQRMFELAKKHGVTAYLSTPIYIPEDRFKFTQDVIAQNATGGTVRFYESHSFKSKDQIFEYALKTTGLSEDQVAQLMANTEHLAKKCQNIKFDFKPIIPRVPKENFSAWKNAELREKLTLLGKKFKDRYLGHIINDVCPKDEELTLTLLIILEKGKINFDDEQFVVRLEYDIFTNQRNGVVKLIGYYLPIADVINNVINVCDEYGPIEETPTGRGSAAACMINYGLDITSVDPVKWNLDPRRFLSPERAYTVNTEIKGFPKPPIK
ncbi:PHP domain-containing protein [Bdellovibrio sp. BCCA]|uniref:PHP domain-containing protein n=1 Tax=Bdellovibrio sp. BCCA TaxID=3136281 RepID=UPI0030EFD46F